MDERYIKFIRLLNLFNKFLSIFKYILIFVSAIFVITNIVFYSGLLDILFKIAIAIIINVMWFYISKVITNKILINKEENVDEE